MTSTVDQEVGTMVVLKVTLPGVVIVQFLESVRSVEVQFWVAYVASVTLVQLVLKPREI